MREHNGAVFTAEQQLQHILAMDAASEAEETIGLSLSALGRYVQQKTGLTELLILRKDAPHRMLAAGADGYSDELLSLARVVVKSGSSWESTRWGECIALGIGDKTRLAFLVARSAGGLTPDRIGALEFFAKHLSRALTLLSVREELVDRSLELSTVYDIDRIRDMHLPFDEMVERIMARVLDIVSADSVLLAMGESAESVHHTAYRQGAKGARAPLPADVESALASVWTAVYAQKRPVEMTVGDPPRATLTLPVVLEGECIGALLLLARPGHGLSARDARLFRAVASQTDTAIFEDQKREALKDVFSKYVSRDVFSEMLDRREDFLSGKRADVTCLFSDLRGFTTVAEEMPVDQVVTMLNEHFEAMTAVVFEMGGTVDKFIGDCVMAFFGAPLPQEDHAERAVRCAVKMRQVHNQMRAKWEADGLPSAKIGIGVHTGNVFVGPVGGENLLSYTVIGDDVNLASRLEGVSGGDDVLISGTTLEFVKDWATTEARGEITVKGKSVPTQVYNVTAVKA